MYQSKAGHINSPFHLGTYSKPVIPPLSVASHSKGSLIMPMESTWLRWDSNPHRAKTMQQEHEGCCCYGSPDFPHDCKDTVKAYSQSEASGVARFQNLTCWSPDPAFLKKLTLKNTGNIFFINIAPYRVLGLWSTDHFFKQNESEV